MQFRSISLARVREKEKTGVFKFVGRDLGRAVDKKTATGRCMEVEIYQTDEGIFITYLTYYDKGGELILADFVETNRLGLSTVRDSLKQAGLYPGPFYSKAVYRSFDTLGMLE